MRSEVIMPRMGQSMEEGVVLHWLKAIGEWVTRGEPLVEIETDKATIDIQAFVTGRLVEILIPEGKAAPVGMPIAIIEDQASALAAAPPEPGRSFAVATIPAAPGAKAPRPNASPLAKRMAQEYGIDLLALEGTGPGGRIGKDDIQTWLSAHHVPAAASSGAPAASNAAISPAGSATSPVVRVPLSRIKQTAARRMSESKAQAPHFYVSMDIDMRRALDLRQSLKDRGISISINDLILKAAALALAHFPNLNAAFAGDAIERSADINLAVAVALGDEESEGLITPVISRCQTLSLADMAAASRAAVDRARSGKLNADDLAGGTFTVSNLGMFGVKAFTAIINPPQAAILAVGAVRRVPIFDSLDRVIPAHLLTATLSVDHRVSDGAEAARFLAKLKALLEDAFALVSAI
ncbi:MAG: 2-oxo acid dehydrogenase subunit E2 [Anaerolineae bacterium]|nr:2-oxo acid dehydrogenase subunit E2 [Anaerolineae bacterium]